MNSYPDRRPLRKPALLLTATVASMAMAALSSGQSAGVADLSTAPSSLQDARLKMSKWIEIQQIISKERNEWQQGKEILIGRLELVKKEISTLEEKLKQAEESVSETARKRDDLAVENDQFKAVGEQLTKAVTALEQEIRRLHKALPEPLQAKLQPLYQLLPEDPATTRIYVAERYRNALGILNEITKANNEITVNYEVRTLANNKPSEVQAMYVGLAQGYYISARGEAGIGRPTADGWTWQPSNQVARDVMMALEIHQGKQSPAFVPLPVKLQ